MSATLDTLFSLLDQHLKHYESLAAFIDREQLALIDQDLDRLQSMVKAKETVILKIKLLIPLLSRAVQAVALEIGLEPDPLPTLTELAKAAPPAYSRRLERAGLAMARLKKKITRLNETNRTFVQETLDLVSGSMAVLTGAPTNANSGYLSTGQRAPHRAPGPVRLSREV